MNGSSPQCEIWGTVGATPTLRNTCQRLLLAAALAAAWFVPTNRSFAIQADSAPVFHCTFSDDWDVNYDSWPDRWVRKTGPGFPHYVIMAIQKDSSVADGKCLTIDLDGAAAAISSPPIHVMSNFSYVFTAQLKTEELKFSSVVVTLDFCDAAGRVLQSAKTEPVVATNGWKAIHIDVVEPRDRAIDHAVLNLQVLRGTKGDLKGRVSLGDVRIERQPRIDVSLNNPCNVYNELQAVTVKCSLSGIRQSRPEICFQLLDGSNHELQSKTLTLSAHLIGSKPNQGAVADGGEAPDGYEGTLEWQPQIPDYGFYRVVVRMKNTTAGGDETEELLPQRTEDFVVVRKLDMPRQGEFCWTLPDGDGPLSLQDLSRLLAEVGINWVKLPVWFDANDPRRGDELIRFVEMLGASNIDVVGIIDRPPGKLADGSRMPRDICISDVLSPDSTAWAAALEPVMSRLALRVRWWQLGRDNDTSLIGSPTLNKRINDLRTILFRFGQDVRMGLCGDWEAADAYTGDVAWDFVQLVSQGTPTKKKFEEQLSRTKQNSAQRWISVDPPPIDRFQPPPTSADVAVCVPTVAPQLGSIPVFEAWGKTVAEVSEKQEAMRKARAVAYVHRLISAKLRAADAIIVARPFDDAAGLLRADGMPGELLLPWRTTAAMLGGGQYLGEMQLPSSSANRIFLRPDGQVVMVAWSREPVREVLYLGENIQQFDMLGRLMPAKKQGREQVIEVGPEPTFVLGLHEAITRWRMHVAFERTQIPSVFSKPHADSLTFENYFPQGVGGTVKIVVVQDPNAIDTSGRPDSWTIEPPQAAFQLAAGATTKFPFNIKLKNALYGKQAVRVDFTVEADERLQFSVYKNMEVGTDEFDLDVRSRLDKDGTLIVEQRMTNLTDRLVDFKCHLRTRGRQPQRMQVYRLGRQPDRKVYRIPDGRDLVGQELLLDIEEINGLRLLNYRFMATAAAPPISDSENTPDTSAEKDSGDSDDATSKPLAKLGS